MNTGNIPNVAHRAESDQRLSILVMAAEPGPLYSEGSLLVRFNDREDWYYVGIEAQKSYLSDSETVVDSTFGVIAGPNCSQWQVSPIWNKLATGLYPSNASRFRPQSPHDSSKLFSLEWVLEKGILTQIIAGAGGSQGVVGQSTSTQMSSLEDALLDLAQIVEEALEKGFPPPNESVRSNVQRLITEIHQISSRRFEVYPMPDGGIAIDSSGKDNRWVFLHCKSDGGALCLVNVNGERDHRRYEDTDLLPDDFLRETLEQLDSPQTS